LIATTSQEKTEKVLRNSRSDELLAVETLLKHAKVLLGRTPHHRTTGGLTHAKIASHQ